MDDANNLALVFGGGVINRVKNEKLVALCQIPAWEITLATL
jgi:hypothetical protein